MRRLQKLLQEGRQHKRTLASRTLNLIIDEYCATALKAGAPGGKLSGGRGDVEPSRTIYSGR